MNSVPSLTWLVTRIFPRCFSMMPYTMLSPMPIPSPTFFVVKKGSKIFGSSLSGMPQPLSRIATVTRCPWEVVLIQTSPLPEMAWLAFSNRFMKT